MVHGLEKFKEYFGDYTNQYVFIGPQFIERIKEDKPDLKNLGIRGTSLDEMLEILGDIFLGKAEA